MSIESELAAALANYETAVRAIAPLVGKSSAVDRARFNDDLKRLRHLRDACVALTKKIDGGSGGRPRRQV